MAVLKACFGIYAAVIIAVFYVVTLPVSAAEFSSSPAPAPTSDGTTIDQGIAYVLMLVALVLTYIIH
ncbi:arabinogalactan protein 41-like [Benincasa hispida]|uniref:arabinogalactan protein 41-like n=1 Tax=Benincasa hispida TaxID=102211 RepID=UPI0019019061|nr:arabinogalactan protein 41-like [Benincasa hispida]XP_038898069.1 arabinogalactan protein 41-like [Benincasa hispida]